MPPQTQAQAHAATSMSENQPPVNPWDRPVSTALDQIETMPGLWDQFRYWGTGTGGPMNAVTIYAYAPTADKFLARFAVVDGGFSMSTHDRRPMEATEVASALGVDPATFRDGAALLETALRESLDTFNSAHHPARRAGPSTVNPAGPASAIPQSAALQEAMTTPAPNPPTVGYSPPSPRAR